MIDSPNVSRIKWICYQNFLLVLSMVLKVCSSQPFRLHMHNAVHRPAGPVLQGVSAAHTLNIFIRWRC